MLVFCDVLVQNSAQFSSVQSLSHIQLSSTPWTAACQVSLSITNSQSLLKLMSIESVVPCNHLILCCPFLLPSILPIHIRWPKYWSFSFSISPSNQYSGLISCRLDLLAVQGTLKSPLQHHGSKASDSEKVKERLSDTYWTGGLDAALLPNNQFISTWVNSVHEEQQHLMPSTIVLNMEENGCF